MEYTVKQLAKLAGISVRTLHYYDEIGLLEPSYVKPNGYRCYGKAELMKLQQILFFRELEFSLEQIAEIFEAPDFDAAEALADQRKLLAMKRARLDRLMATIDTTLKAIREETDMAAEEMYGSFSKEQMEEMKQEVQEKWGSKQLDQSEQRTKNWKSADYKRVEAEGKAIVERIASLMDRGPDDDEVQEQIALYFKHISIFYDCTSEIFRGLGGMYVTDQRFADYFRKYDDGLPEFMRQAMAAYCDRNP
jgi:DNA-binding transcriptional MerR regulator